MLVEAVGVDANRIRSDDDNRHAHCRCPTFTGLDELPSDAVAASGLADDETPNLRARTAFERIGQLHVNPAEDAAVRLLGDEQLHVAAMLQVPISACHLRLSRWITEHGRE